MSEQLGLFAPRRAAAPAGCPRVPGPLCRDGREGRCPGGARCEELGEQEAQRLTQVCTGATKSAVEARTPPLPPGGRGGGHGDGSTAGSAPESASVPNGANFPGLNAWLRSRISRPSPNASSTSSARPMRSIELFTGAGGLALGIHVAGFRHRALIEWNADACQTLRRNVERDAVPGISDWAVLKADIKNVPFQSLGPVDLVAGGVPCQPFSLGGKHLGMDDERNMFPDFVRAVRELAPRAFIIENVKGLLREGFRNYFEYIKLQLAFPTATRKRSEDWASHLRRLEKLQTSGRATGVRYNVVSELLNSADYGVPQVRERVFIVGFRRDTGLEWSFPSPTHSLAALKREQLAGDYWTRHGVKPPKGTQGMTIPANLGEDMKKPWRTVRDALQGLPEPREDREARGFTNHILIPGARSYHGHTGSPVDMPAKTLKAGVHGVPGGENMLADPSGRVRYFSVREAARIQTFPDDWRFEGSWSEAMRQLGNAVPLDLAAVVARSVAERLGTGNGN